MSNKNILLSVVVVTLLALSAGFAWAEETRTDASGSVVKWQQLPDMKYGVNIQSTEVDPIVADDWKCRDPRPVNDVHFWGSYISWETGNEKPQSILPKVDIFIIRIYKDVPANTDLSIPYSHPGKLLYAVKVDRFKERYVSAIPHPDNAYEHKFYYSLDLPKPFEQKEGTIYWISIAAVMPEGSRYQWGWETSRDHWNDNACRQWSRIDHWEELTPKKMPRWYQEHHKTVDMAFELTVKPNPDLGDAPDTTNSFSATMTAYPGVKAYFPTVYQAGSPPHGPIHRQPKDMAFLGKRVSLEREADIGFDEDGVNNIVPRSDKANLDKADDCLIRQPVLVHCKLNTFDYVVTVVDPMQKSIYVNVWFDWNRDGDWDDRMACLGVAGPVLAPEWAVQNQQLYLSSPGVFTFTTPRFRAWLSPDGTVQDGTWMRITLSERKWDPSAYIPYVGGSGPAGGYRYGETEDHYVTYAQPPPNAKWVQMPDLTTNGIDIKVDGRNTLADDFKCTSPSLLTDVHFWGSWKKDFKGEIANIHLSIHSDDPVGVGGTDPDNKFSKPDELLWERDFSSREFKESPYHTVPRPGEWWWDPASGELIQGGDSQVWQYDIKIDPDEAFFQGGTRKLPNIYWLEISVKTEEGEFGWKTRQWPDHFMDDAVWDRGSELPRLWNELRYPKGHPYYGLEDNSIDMAFILTFEEMKWTTVNIEPPSQNVCPGSFTVDVTVNPAESITGVQFDLNFDTSLVRVDGVMEGDLLSQDGASTFFTPGTINNAAGTLTGAAGAITTPDETVSTSGVFATIRMTAKSVEGTSSLDLSNVIVGNINGDPMPIKVNDGTVTITTCIGDVNGDGTVNVLDMIRISQHWGETGTSGWIPEDVNRDGAINVLDMILIGQNWGPCP